ncbi:MAG: DUF1499 domain-containing protein [Halorhodospira sp.]
MFQAPVSRLATASALLAACGAAIAAAAGPLYRLRLLELDPALWMIAAGTLAGVAGLVFGLGGVLATLGLRGKRGRGRALLGIALGAGLVVVPGPAVYSALTNPPLYDVTTDPDQPPTFDALASARERASAPVEHPGEEAAEQQAAFAPELEPRYYEVPGTELLKAAERAALKQGWTVARTDVQGVVEAAARSHWLGLVHDVAVRIREAESGWRVDVRVAARKEGPDPAANAALARAFFHALEAELTR